MATERTNVEYIFSGDTSRLDGALSSILTRFDNLDNKVKGISNALGSGLANSFKSVGKAVTSFLGLKLGQSFGASIKSLNTMIENVNLFNVAMGDSKEVMSDFVNNMANLTGLDPSNFYRYAGTFQLLSESIGVANKEAGIISDSFTRLAVEMSSLYNVPVEKAFEKLSAGLIGQSRPLREFGINVTNAALQEQALALGITRKLTALNEAEKVILRYITVLNQAQTPLGDFANSVESPANQVKIFTNQLVMLARNIASLVMPALQAILPVLNGILMVINALIGVIARLFGFKIEDYTAGATDSAKGASGAYDGLGNSIAKTGKKAKKTKKEMDKLTAPFDELNILEPPSAPSGAGAGAGGLGGGGLGLGEIDPKLLAAMKSMEDTFSNIKMKAVEIRDAIMSWLGFIYDGEEGWKFVGNALTNVLKENQAVVESAMDFSAHLAARVAYNNIVDIVDEVKLLATRFTEAAKVGTNIDETLQLMKISAGGAGDELLKLVTPLTTGGQEATKIFTTLSGNVEGVNKVLGTYGVKTKSATLSMVDLNGKMLDSALSIDLSKGQLSKLLSNLSEATTRYDGTTDSVEAFRDAIQKSFPGLKNVGLEFDNIVPKLDVVAVNSDKAKDGVRAFVSGLEDITVTIDPLKIADEAMAALSDTARTIDSVPLSEIIASVSEGVEPLARFHTEGSLFAQIMEYLGSASTTVSGSLGQFFGLLQGPGLLSMTSFNMVFDLFKAGWQTISGFIVDPIDAVLWFIEAIWTLYNENVAFNSSVKALWQSLKDFIGAVVGLLGGILGGLAKIFFTVFGTIDNIVVWFLTNFDGVFTGVVDIIRGVIDFLTGVFTGDWKKAWSGVVTIFKGIGEMLAGAVRGIATTISQGFANAVTWVVEKVSNFAVWLITKFTNMVDDVSYFVTNWRSMLGNGIQGAVDWVREKIVAFGGWFKTKATEIANAFVNPFKGLGAALKSPFNGIIDAANKLIASLNRLFAKSWPDWIPGIGGKPIGPQIPSIPRLAQGGVITRPTMAVIGEAGRSEAVIPLESSPQMAEFINAIVGAIQDKPTTPPVEVKVVIGDREWDSFVYRSWDKGKRLVGSTPVGGAFNV